MQQQSNKLWNTTVVWQQTGSHVSSLRPPPSVSQPMHDDYDLRQEQLNKASLLSSKKFLENLLEKFISNVVRAAPPPLCRLYQRSAGPARFKYSWRCQCDS